MALAARMEIRQGQGLVITPQLQQAIKLLQLSNIELDAFVETELERNPLLARDEGDAEPEVEIASAAADYETHELPDAVAAAELDAPTVYDDASPSERASGDAPTPDAADAGWVKAASAAQTKVASRRGAIFMVVFCFSAQRGNLLDLIRATSSYGPQQRAI